MQHLVAVPYDAHHVTEQAMGDERGAGMYEG